MNFDYTNPGFCISETYTPPAKVQRHDPNFRSVREPKRTVFRGAATNGTRPQNLNSTFNGLAMMELAQKQQFQQQQQQQQLQQTQFQNAPPKPGPKPVGLSTMIHTEQRIVEGLASRDKNGNVMRSQSLLDHRATSIEALPPTMQTPSGRYALVPIEEVPAARKDRYEILPLQTAAKIFHKSHDLIFNNAALEADPEDDEDEETPHNRSQPQFSSLPPLINTSNNEPKSQMKNAFSTNFDPNMLLRSDSKYTLIPTEKDEEIVDDNHEVIEIHNGKQVHRYAVLSTDIDEEDEDAEEETCLSDNSPVAMMMPLTPQRRAPMIPQQPQFINFNPNNSYATIREKHTVAAVASPQKFMHPMATSSPQKISTPQKNNLATQRLHELLSTPPKPKSPLVHQNRTPQKMTRFQPTPTRFEYETREEVYQRTTTPIQSQRQQQIQQQQPIYSPQRLRYDQRTMSQASVATTATNGDLRTTAIITPRLQQLQESADSRDVEAFNKSRESDIYKIASAARTIGGIAFMMIICGMLNAGLCLYIIALRGLVYYLISGIISGFLCVALGCLGLKSQRTPWFPNRNYVSGLVLVIVFSLLNCSALSALIAVRPAIGSPIHDMITGVVLGLSVLKVILICLGVVTSQCCNLMPPDNRVQVR